MVPNSVATCKPTEASLNCVMRIDDRETAADSQAFEYAPFAEQQTRKCGKEKCSDNGGEGDGKHLQAELRDKALEVFVAADADADLQH